MLYCYGKQEDEKKTQERNYNKAMAKLNNKIGAIKMLINDCNCSKQQKELLKFKLRNSTNF